MKCKKCDNVIEDNLNFCVNCGRMNENDFADIISAQIKFLNKKLNIDNIEKAFKVISFVCSKKEKNNYNYFSVINQENQINEIQSLICDKINELNENCELTFGQMHELLEEKYKCNVFFRPIPHLNRIDCEDKEKCLFIVPIKLSSTVFFNKVLSNLLKYLLDKFNKNEWDKDLLSDKLTAEIISDTSRDYINEKTSNSFNTIANLSYSQYERKENKGIILFCSESTIDNRFKFAEEFQFCESNIRLLRKIIEGADDITPLVVVENKIIGYGKANRAAKIEYIGSHFWRFYYEDGFEKGCYIEYKNGLLEFKYVNKDIIADSVLGEIFPNKNTAKEAFKNILEHLTKVDKHGALFIITSPQNAKSEAERLSQAKQCCKWKDAIEPLLSNNTELAQYFSFSKIDGALMLDFDLKCYAISCILDGVAKHHGDLARGSRYNSSLVYIASKAGIEESFYAVILSEDGGLEILHNKADEKKSFVMYQESINN